jgi:AcrR family transcriptional regulator
LPRPRSITDDQLLDAAGRVLLRRGASAFTIADVAAEAGIAPATVLQRYTSKYNLLLAYGRRATERAGRPFDQVEAAGLSPLAALWQVLFALAEGLEQGLDVGISLLAEDMRDPALREAAAAHARVVEERLCGALARAMAAGELPPGDAAALARTVQAIWNGALIQWGLRREGSLADWLAASLVPVLGPRP